MDELKGFSHKIVLKEDACPCIHKVRNIPMSVKEEVVNEIQKLVDNELIERVESLDWVAPWWLHTRPMATSVSVWT